MSRARAIIHLEALASVGLTAILLAVFAAAVVQYAGVRREVDARRELVFAATAELDRIRAGLVTPEPATAQPASAAQPGEVVLSTTYSPGEGPWAGLTRVCIVATRQMGARRELRVEVRGYVGPEERP
ncbi:MAG: hypothetical protein AB1716_11095 [Planctomycetota bacterium]